jgi:hypothetical protein
MNTARHIIIAWAGCLCKTGEFDRRPAASPDAINFDAHPFSLPSLPIFLIWFFQ